MYLITLVRLRVVATMEWGVNRRLGSSISKELSLRLFFLLFLLVSTLGHYWFALFERRWFVCARVRVRALSGDWVSWLALKHPSWVIDTILARSGSSIQSLLLGQLCQAFPSVSEHSKERYWWLFILWGYVWIWKTVTIYLEPNLLSKWVGDESRK